MLSVASLFLEQIEDVFGTIAPVIHVFDFTVLFLTLFDTVAEIIRSKNRKAYIRKNWLSLGFLALFVLLFGISKSSLFIPQSGKAEFSYYRAVIIIRNIFLVLKIFQRVKKFTALLESLTLKPAQTILLSFFMVILCGALVLMMPFTTVDGKGLPFLDAWFTATSAVCVTGLIVVDTAAVFTRIGQTVIVLLIQIGGLGIMIISYFTLFSLRKRLSVEEKLLISYMISQSDMNQLSKTIKGIILSTLAIEGTGFLLFTIGFSRLFGLSGTTLFYGFFHSISAFCNAGFALFSDSLEGFTGSALINITAALLIICGGISFSVIMNLSGLLRGKTRKLTLNTRMVLIITGLLLLTGTLLIYGLEHGNTLRNYPLGVQYLASFFQSVTLRTAGFNTIPLGGLTAATVAVMIVFMFIGAATGSTGGGIKVNTIGVIYAYVASVLKNRDKAVLSQQGINSSHILKAFLILLFGLLAVTFGTILLSVTEKMPYISLLFESVSAFATVGLTLGITPDLSSGGRIIIIFLMFAGRLGPLTILSAATVEDKKVRIEYPEGDVSLG